MSKKSKKVKIYDETDKDLMSAENETITYEEYLKMSNELDNDPKHNTEYVHAVMRYLAFKNPKSKAYKMYKKYMDEKKRVNLT